MKQRRDRLARAANVTETLWRLQQMRLGPEEIELGEIRVATAAAFETLERLEPAVTTQRIAFLSQRRVETEQAISYMRELARDYGARAKLAEKSYRKVNEAMRREEADTERGALSRADVSAPKGD
jgi:hypothetical protein